MKKLTLIFILFLSFIIYSCGSVSNYSKNSLNKSFYENKTIYFTLNPNSVQDVKMSGLYTNTIFDDGITLNVENSFKQSIEELATETKLNLKYINSTQNLSDNETLINVEIIDISWHFGFSVAKMKTNVIYKNQNFGTIYTTEGIRKSGGGSKSNNLKKSLKNANYKFLKELETQKL